MEELLDNNKFFGTDGIRGTPGVYPLTDGMIFKIGISVAKFILYRRKPNGRPKVVIARDSHITGTRIEQILANAINSSGIDVVSVGVITTPGLSFMVRDIGAEMGIMVSASHTKSIDNGIKFFKHGGSKLLKEEEEWIESIIFNSIINRLNGSRTRNGGKFYSLAGSHARYSKFLLSIVKGLKLKGMRIYLDCGWGAASEFAGGILKRLGASVTAMNNKPLGGSISLLGEANPLYLQKLTLEPKMDIGIAFDGDGDRVVLVDEKGTAADGDTILAILTNHFIKCGRLPEKTIVTTVMSNLGLKEFIESIGGKVVVTEVGDKYVFEELIKRKLNLGGEQSGHIIFLEYLPASDGLLTALQVLKIMKDTGAKLSELANCFKKVPQVLINVRVREKRPFDMMLGVSEKLTAYNSQLKGEGRIVLRYSGTKDLARVMVEGKEKQIVENIASSLADEIKEEIGEKRVNV